MKRRFRVERRRIDGSTHYWMHITDEDTHEMATQRIYEECNMADDGGFDLVFEYRITEVYTPL